jgi:tRNA-dihydrouridine synthase
MKEPKKIKEIIEAAVKSVKVPVTLKTRISLNRTDILGPLLAKTAQDAGATAVTIHARAAADVHSGPPDLAALEACCKAVSIPVIGNGGVTGAAQAKAMFEAGCQGVMIGRAAIGNPYIFRDIAQILSGQEAAPLTLQEKLTLYLELIEENVKLYGEKTGVSRSKKTVGFWINGFNGASAAREKLVRATTLKEAKDIFTTIP